MYFFVIVIVSRCDGRVTATVGQLRLSLSSPPRPAGQTDRRTDGRAMSGENHPADSVCPAGEEEEEEEDRPAEDPFCFGDDLELNRFDGLPFSSRYYQLLRERTSLPVWRARGQFEAALAHNQLLIVSGTAKTGRSTQVRTLKLGGWGGEIFTHIICSGLIIFALLNLSRLFVYLLSTSPPSIHTL